MSNVTKVDAVVIGAGVLGLAVARALSSSVPQLLPSSLARTGGGGRRRKRQRRREVLLLERNSAMGRETSSRSSQVIHAGLYYPVGSLKARWCVEGRKLLYAYCDERSIPANRCGKVVVATSMGQVDALWKLHRRAVSNGVDDAEMISAEQVRDLEPELTTTVLGLWSPSTGIVDAHDLMQHLLTDAERDGSTTLVLNTHIKEARISRKGRVQLSVPTDDDGQSSEENWLDCNVVVNAAGLWADEVARTIHHGGSEDAAPSPSPGSWQPPRQYYCRGTYFRLEGGRRHAPFTHLVYPIPDPKGGLGVHATLDEGGQVKFGPDVEWLPIDTSSADNLSYVPDPNRAESFYESIRRYWPGLPADSLVPDYCGIRPKLSHPGLPDRRQSRNAAFRDFCVAGPDEHGVQGLVHLLGMESPGLTSALAVAEHVADLLEDA